MSIKEKQKNIKDILKKIGKSQIWLANSILDHKGDVYHEEDRERFVEKFKKQLNRTTTSEVILNEYLAHIYDLDEYESAIGIKLKNRYKDNFDEKFNQKMKQISESIFKNVVSDKTDRAF